MSENLTVSLKIAQESHTTAPEPGHCLVVFETIGEGRRFKTILAADQTFTPERRGGLVKDWFSRKSSYVSYAVNPLPPEIEFS
ncbi:MAG: hypothetical protein P8104_01690, partial [Gammaproteobacteria bacterium]